MKPLLLMRAAPSARTEVKIVLGTVGFIALLPAMAVLLIAHTSLAALTYGLVGGGTLYQGAASTTDLYAYGNCTYWAALLREQAGKPIPNSWGNANTWALNALLSGYTVDGTPTPTAIMETTAGDLGHVAYVESVNASSGSWTISEMNTQGFDIVNTQTLPASAAKAYSFIHDKVQP